MPDIPVKLGDVRGILTVGGQHHQIVVDGVTHIFEDHQWCGPVKLNKRGDPAKHQPHDFLHAVSLWAQQGRKLKGGVAQWEPGVLR